jgi:uncharacterized protein
MGKSARIDVHLQPRGARDELRGWRDGVLRVKVSAPPVEGKANLALCRLIAKRLAVPPSRVSVVRGERSRDKVIAIEGMDATAVKSVLSP